MTDPENTADPGGDLRRRAEKKLRAADAPAASELSREEAERTLHELRVHQIELEMQNDELHRAHQALEDSRAQYFRLYELAPVGYITMNRAGMILEANFKAAGLLGTQPEALAKKYFHKFVLEADQDALYLMHKALFGSASRQTCELRMLREGGYPIWVRLEAEVSLEPRSAEPLARIIMSDVTDRRHAEGALRESRSALLNTNKNLQIALRELDSRTNHLRLLARDLALTEQRERKRLSQVLHDGLQQHLLAAKIRVEGVSERIGAGDLKKAIDEIENIIVESVKISRSLSAELSPPILHDGGLTEGLEWLVRWMRDKHHFTVDLSIGTRPDLDDEVKILLFESVRELLLNALKHANVSMARVSLAHVDGAKLRITVSDDGVGFDPGQLKPPGDEGGGFGLFSVRERVGLIGGVLEIESAPAKGSRFTLTVPARKAPTAPHSASHNVAVTENYDKGTNTDAGEVIRILVADDHTLFRDGLARMLRARPDFKVVGFATDGGEAIDLAEKLKPDVILMDISMPGLNGIEATRILHREHPEISIIGLSMYEDQERGQAMRDAGACDYQNKGCAIGDLVSSIRGCVLRK